MHVLLSQILIVYKQMAFQFCMTFNTNFRNNPIFAFSLVQWNWTLEKLLNYLINNLYFIKIKNCHVCIGLVSLNKLGALYETWKWFNRYRDRSTKVPTYVLIFRKLTIYLRWLPIVIAACNCRSYEVDNYAQSDECDKNTGVEILNRSRFKERIPSET